MKPQFQFSSVYETSLQKEFQDLLEAFTNLQHEHEACLNHLEQMKANNERGRAKLSEQLTEIERLNSIIKQYTQAHESWSVQHKAQTNLAKQQEDLMQQSEVMIHWQRRQIESLTNSLQSLNSEHKKDLTEKLSEQDRLHQQQIKAKTEEIASLQKKLEECESWKRWYKEDAKTQEQMKQEYLAVNKQLLSNNETLMTQNKHLRSTINNQQEQTSTLHGLINKFKSVFSIK